MVCKSVNNLKSRRLFSDRTIIAMSWQRVLWHQRNLFLGATLAPLTIPLTRWSAKRFLAQFVATRSPVVVALQMGKVASTALAQHVRAAASCPMIVSAHYCERNGTPVEHGAPTGSAVLFPTLADLSLLKSALKSRTEAGRTTRFLAGVRNPVDRLRSALLQNLESHLVRERLRIVMLPRSIAVTANDLSARLHTFERRFQLEWFERELQPVSGIDVYSVPFPRTDGFATYSRGPSELFLYRYESIGNRQLIRALNSWLGCPDAPEHLPRINETAPRMKSLRRAIQSIHLDRQVESEILSSRLYTHFYGE